MRSFTEHVWAIAYIKSDQIHLVEAQLKRNAMFENVEAYIPTVKLLKKTVKSKPEFIQVPMLFNYGFFKIPTHLAISSSFLMNLRNEVSVIYGWVKEPKKLVRCPIIGADGEVDYKNINAALATDEEVANLIAAAASTSVHTKEEIKELEVGCTIQLRGYPFEGLYGTVNSIDIKRHKLEVKLNLEGIFKNVTIDFQNVFYTVYASSDDSLMGHEDIEKAHRRKNMDIINVTI
jgi:transcription antitermination factor NusG